MSKENEALVSAPVALLIAGPCTNPACGCGPDCNCGEACVCTPDDRCTDR